MKKFFIYASIVSFLLLTGCTFNLKNIDQYVGEYTMGINYYRKKHYYWGSSKLLEEKPLVSRSMRLTINNDGSVLATYEDHSSTKGRVRKCDEKTIRISGIDYISSYTFTYKKDGYGVSLEYYYTEQKIGVEYDYVSKGLSFVSVNNS